MACPTSSAIQALLDAGLRRDPARAFEVHMDGCDECREVVAELVRGAGGDATLEIGGQVGRYVITGHLGGGAMGVVYAARDPELDRKVALKLLREGGADRTGLRARLHREAQAMARLAHPNVVTVHDVGEHGDQIFIAMELVEGQTLTDWLRVARPWQEVLAVFVAAGRGLAAAHAAGLVHRDVKPDNILLGVDRRARITDFGLVGASGPAAGDATLAAGSGDLTVTGTVMGTPAYMAPEQHRGEAVDARSDQFCFCVALFEGLFGRRPFAGRSIGELAGAGPAAIDVPRRPAVPAGLVRALRRGLEPDPARRHPSVAALLDELEAVPRALRRRRVGAAIAIAVLLALGGGALAWRSGRTAAAVGAEAQCGGGRAEIARAWSPERAAALAAAFTASGAPDAARRAAEVAGAIDRYVAEWTTTHREACAATRVSGHQSEALLDRRVRCLTARRDELDAVVTQLGQVDRAGVARGLAAVRALAPIADCGGAALAAVAAPPPGSEARLREVEASLARIDVRRRAGEFERLRPLVDAALREARAIGHPPLTARALATLAHLDEQAGDLATAERRYTEAVAEAERGGDDRLRGRYLVTLGWVVGNRRLDPARGLPLLAQAETVLARVGDASQAPRVAAIRGLVLSQAARYDEAIASLELARRLHEANPGPPTLAAAGVADDLASVLQESGRTQEALRENERAVALARAAAGPRHPDVGRMRANQGVKLAAVGRHEEALAAYREAIAIQGEAHGEGSWQVALDRANAGAALDALGRYGEALAELAAARALFVKIDGDDRTVRVALVDYYASGVRVHTGELDAALALAGNAAAIGRLLLGADHPDVAAAESQMAWIELERGRAAEARALAARALPIAERSRRRLLLGDVLAVSGAAAVDLGRAAEAIAPLERALALYGEQPGAEWGVAGVRFALARARHALGDRAAARALAEAARAGYAALGDRHRRDVARLERWLRRRPSTTSPPAAADGRPSGTGPAPSSAPSRR